MNKYLIKDLMNVNRGSSPRPIIEYLSESGYRWLKISDFNLYDRFVYETKEFIKESGLKNTRHLPAGTLILTNSATPGIPIFLGRDMCLHDGFLYFTNIKDDIINVNYLYYWFLYNRNKIINQANGSVFKNLKKDIVENFEISVPDMDIQLKIVKILDDINNKLELNNKINNNLYEEAVALYKDKFKGIEQGEKTIGEYILPKRGKNLLTRDAVEGEIPVVAGGLEPSAYHNQSNTKSPVITISASGANAGYTNLWNIPVWASDCSYIDESITKNVYFWYIVLKTRQNEIFDAQTGSAQPHIYPQHIAEMPIDVLNDDEVEKYNTLVEPLFKMIGNNKTENIKISQLRDALLPKLMNGEIDLDNIEI